jgi:hypothetical protein
LVNSDNFWRLIRLVDPFLNPIIRGLLCRVGVLERSGPATIPKMHSIPEFDCMLETVGLQKVNAMTLGFGPFSLFRKQILPEPLGVRMHETLQSWSERGVPVVKWLGSQYVVLVRKPERP